MKIFCHAACIQFRFKSNNKKRWEGLIFFVTVRAMLSRYSTTQCVACPQAFCYYIDETPDSNLGPLCQATCDQTLLLQGVCKKTFDQCEYIFQFCIQALEKKVKIFSYTVSILPRNSNTNFEISNTAAIRGLTRETKLKYKTRSKTCNE